MGSPPLRASWWVEGGGRGRAECEEGPVALRTVRARASAAKVFRGVRCRWVAGRAWHAAPALGTAQWQSALGTAQWQSALGTAQWLLLHPAQPQPGMLLLHSAQPSAVPRWCCRPGSRMQPPAERAPAPASAPALVILFSHPSRQRPLVRARQGTTHHSITAHTNQALDAAAAGAGGHQPARHPGQGAAAAGAV